MIHTPASPHPSLRAHSPPTSIPFMGLQSGWFCFRLRDGSGLLHAFLLWGLGRGSSVCLGRLSPWDGPRPRTPTVSRQTPPKLCLHTLHCPKQAMRAWEERSAYGGPRRHRRTLSPRRWFREALKGVSVPTAQRTGEGASCAEEQQVQGQETAQHLQAAEQPQGAVVEGGRGQILKGTAGYSEASFSSG